jgi:Family of unknown function (DUF6152)
MIRMSFRRLLMVMPLIGIAYTANAHHPPRFERCQMFSYAGQIEEIDWTNPHVQLILRTDDGERQEIGWLGVRGLHRAGIDVDTLHVGDHVVVEGALRPKDALDEPLLPSSIHRTSDGWEWSQPLQGC